MSVRKAGELDIGLLIQKPTGDATWDPNNVGSWNIRGDDATALAIYDRLY